MSKGEDLIEKMLLNIGLEYEKEKTFDDMTYLGSLRCDFYIPKYGCGIEVDGEQHEECPHHGGGEKTLGKNQMRDKKKDEYFKTRGLKLIRIPYNKLNVLTEQYLEHKIKQCKYGVIINLKNLVSC